jgi:hypothetical protein
MSGSGGSKTNRSAGSWLIDTAADLTYTFAAGPSACGEESAMLTLVHLSVAALRDPASLTVLADLAIDHQLVLICAQGAPPQPIMARLRDALPNRRLIAVLVTGEAVAPERRLVEQLVAEGIVPLIVTADDPAAVRLVNWFWLPADRVVTLPP